MTNAALVALSELFDIGDSTGKIPFSHCRPRAMDLSRVALRSALTGRTWCRETEAGYRISRAFLNGGYMKVSAAACVRSRVNLAVPSSLDRRWRHQMVRA